MLTDPKILDKLEHIHNRYKALRYRALCPIDTEYAETREHYRDEPGAEAKLEWKPAKPGLRWGGSWTTAWFRGDVRVPAEAGGKRLFLSSSIDTLPAGLSGVETRVLCNGVSLGLFSSNHSVVMLCDNARSGERLHIAIEAYAGHDRSPLAPSGRREAILAETIRVPRKCRTYSGLSLAIENAEVSAFVYDLRVLLDLAAQLDANSLRRGRIVRGLARVFQTIDAVPHERPESSWMPKLKKARREMKPLLEARNGDTTPWFGLIGNSHIDTAWLWPLAETWRKCARTFSSVLNLMEQYPEFLFVQPASCHAEMTEKLYPEIFRRVRAMAKKGRWEPNGGTWVEPDGNIPSGEAFVRQFLVGQSATRRMFGYTSDVMWMPDTFGYSAALPQIMRGCGVHAFCTQKISWNDTTRFPHDSFHWRGIDGTEVLAHFTTTYVIPPDVPRLVQHWNQVADKDVQDRRLGAFGYGDGGGGPTIEMLESARRLEDVEGCPRAQYMRVGEFMRRMRDDLGDELPLWDGEIYLEMHRGTLTSIAGIKKGNRKLELALRDAEILSTAAAIEGMPYPASPLLEAWKDLLTNQFHDILPGSSIPEVNDEARATYARRIGEAREMSAQAMTALAGPTRGATKNLAVFNTLGWERTGEVVLDAAPRGARPADPEVMHQWVEDIEGAPRLYVEGVDLPALGVATVALEKGDAPPSDAPSPFRVAGNRVSTPHATVRFDKAGRIVSLVDKASGREIARKGGAAHSLLIGEDVPANWDNWDVDRSQILKRETEERLVARVVVADGPLQLRIRHRYELGHASELIQDVVFHASSPRIDFETAVEWRESHMMLHAAFDLDILANSARHEIQFGHTERPTHANQPDDWARFEVCAHKWSDLSDNAFGVAVLNDCKYGVGVVDDRLTLSLLRSGTGPDDRGDNGRHTFTYALLPHNGPWSVESVVRPAYELNVAPLSAPAPAKAFDRAPLIEVDAPQVIVEAVKWAEAGDAVVVRLYEAGKTATKATVRANFAARRAAETNMLEEEPRPLGLRGGAVRVDFRPFEIKTVRFEL